MCIFFHNVKNSFPILQYDQYGNQVYDQQNYQQQQQQYQQQDGQQQQQQQFPNCNSIGSLAPMNPAMSSIASFGRMFKTDSHAVLMELFARDQDLVRQAAGKGGVVVSNANNNNNGAIIVNTSNVILVPATNDDDDDTEHYYRLANVKIFVPITTTGSSAEGWQRGVDA